MSFRSMQASRRPVKIAFMIVGALLFVWVLTCIVTSVSKGKLLLALGVRVHIVRTPIGGNSRDPLVAAIERNCSDDDFAAVLKSNPSLRDFGLVLCAHNGWTNRVRICIEQGADASEARIQSLTSEGESNSASLIQWIIDDMKHSVSNTSVEPARALAGGGGSP
jgi:hypothetical protein